MREVPISRRVPREIAFAVAEAYRHLGNHLRPLSPHSFCKGFILENLKSSQCKYLSCLDSLFVSEILLKSTKALS